jgi:4-hydroxy-3-methylbut-2-enyl diphosphate reductase
MYVLNQFLDKGAGAYNDPERAAFLKKHKRLLIATGVGATAFSLLLAYGIGMAAFLSLCAFSLLGIIYSVPIVPKTLQQTHRYSKIKDVPGSRSLSEALAWVAVMGVLPLLEKGDIYWPGAVVSLLVLFLAAYSRSVLFDVFQVQGDLIVGTETLPILIGERKTLKFIKILLLSAGLVLFLGSLLGFSNPYGYVLFLSLIPLFLCVMAYEKRWLNPGIKLEAAVDGNFFLAGFLAVIWQLYPWPGPV